MTSAVSSEILDSLAAPNDLAEQYFLLGRYQEALELYQIVQRIRSLLQGPQHPDTLTISYKIALLTFEGCNNSKGIQMLEENATLREIALGRKHPDALESRNSLIRRLYERENDLVKSRRMQEDMVARAGSTLVLDNLLALALKSNLIYFQFHSGSHAEAIEWNRKLYETQLNILGVSHRETLKTLQDQAGFSLDQGSYAEAIRLFWIVIQDGEKSLGPSHPEVLIMRRNLAIAHYAHQNFIQCVNISSYVAQEQAQVLGEEHWQTKLTRSWLSWARDSPHKEYREALYIQRDILQVSKNKYQPLAFKSKCEVIAASKLDVEKLISGLNQVLAEKMELLGPYHETTFNSKLTLAAMLADLDEYQEALELYKSVLTAQKTTIGENHPAVTETKRTIASILIATKDFVGATVFLQEVLDDMESLHGPEEELTRLARYQLAMVLNVQGKYSEAEVLLHMVLEDEIEKLGCHQLHSMQTLEDLAYTVTKLKRHKEAFLLYKLLILRRSNYLGPNHEDTLRAKIAFVSILEKLRRFDDARPIMREIVQSLTALFGSKHETTTHAKLKLAFLYNYQLPTVSLRNRHLEVREDRPPENHNYVTLTRDGCINNDLYAVPRDTGRN